MPNLNRKDLEARYLMFQTFALDDQRNYYDRTIEKHERAATEVNRIRATISLLTGITAAIAGLLTAIYFTSNSSCVGFADVNTTVENVGFCRSLKWFIDVNIVLSVALPALGGFFSTLADLYQWDKQIALYKTANENIEVADARSPLPEMDDEFYRASVKAYAEGTLQVMSDETAQWGQSIRTPRSIESFVEEARLRALEVSDPQVSPDSLAGAARQRADRTEASDTATDTSNASSSSSSDTSLSSDTDGNDDDTSAG